MQDVYILDCHTHFYPQYDIINFLHSASTNLGNLAPDATKVLCLTERATEHFFQSIGDNEIPGIEIASTLDPAVLQIEFSLGEIFIVSGYQYITQEKLEVLALGSRARFKEGLSIHETVSKILTEGALPVIPWSPGKWLGTRRRILKSFIESELFDKTFLGDIYGHPWWFYEPLLSNYQIKTLYGSDSLPINGDEKNIGKRAVIANGDKTNQSSHFLDGILLGEKTCIGDAISSIEFFKRRLS